MRLSSFAAALLAAACTATREDAAPPVVAAPDNPDTDIFLGRIEGGAGARRALDFHNVTDREGYDNQPYFLQDGSAFFYVAAGATGKTDILRHDFATGIRAPVFVSPDESEYSPREAPQGGVSYIQENPAGDVTRVHRRPPGADRGAAVADFAPVGYYGWLDGGHALAVYYRTDPGSLYRVDLASGAPTLLREKIGRAMQANAAGDALWFTAIEGGDKSVFRLMRYDPANGAQADLFALPDGAEDFAVEFDGGGVPIGVFSASGSILYWRPLKDPARGAWVEVADLSPFGVVNASRVAVDAARGRIAVVGEVRR